MVPKAQSGADKASSARGQGRRAQKRHAPGSKLHPLGSGGKANQPKVVPSAAREQRSVTHFAESEPPEIRHRGFNPIGLKPGTLRTLSRPQAFKMWLTSATFRYPARVTMVIFLILIVLTTGGLMLPGASKQPGTTNLVDAFFTAVSAVCVTGLTVVDTAAHWTFFGQVVIAIGITLGGLGVMTMASLLALVVSRRLGLTQKLLSVQDTRGRLSDTGTLVIGVIVTTLVAEAILFLIILPSFLEQGHDPANATWHALFIAISSFNNAGFVSMHEGLDAYVSNWFVLVPIMLAATVGAIGFPVITDLRRRWRTPSRWSLHTKMTLSTYFALAAITGLIVAVLEWNNANTLGSLGISDRVLNSLVMAITPRSPGMTAIDVGEMTPASWLVTDISMFIGGGSGSHAGGIKVTTFAVVMMAAWAEATGRKDSEAFHRRIPHETLRQAVAVLLGSVMLVLAVSAALLMISPFTLDRILFEVISAFGTVGLSTGITPNLPAAGKVLLAFLMVVGRVGPMTLATALALRQENRLVRMPSERPIVG